MPASRGVLNVRCVQSARLPPNILSRRITTPASNLPALPARTSAVPIFSPGAGLRVVPPGLSTNLLLAPSRKSTVDLPALVDQTLA